MNRRLVAVLLLGLGLRLWLSVQIYSGDVNNHIAWGKDILKLGPAGVYSREFMLRYGTLAPTYPPLALAMFTASQATYDWVYATAWDLNQRFRPFPSNFIFFLQDQDTQPAFFKVWAIAADIGIAWLVYRLTGKVWAAALVAFNPAFFYNSAYWGQIEAVPLFFTLAAVYLLRKQNWVGAAIVLTAALAAKQSTIIYLPLLALLAISRLGYRRALTAGVLVLAGVWLSFLPYYGREGPLLSWPAVTYWHKIQTGSGSDYVTDHAFNWWVVVQGGWGKLSDSTAFWLGRSYRWWGYGLFSLAYAAVVASFAPRKIFSGLAVVSSAAFVLLTRMHERYLEAALPFLLVWAAGRPWLVTAFVALSGFHFLNLYHNWWAPRYDWLVTALSWPDSVLALSGLIGVLFVFLLGSYNRKA